MIIVGAGLTGLSAARELKTTMPSARVKLLEGRDQVKEFLPLLTMVKGSSIPRTSGWRPNSSQVDENYGRRHVDGYRLAMCLRSIFFFSDYFHGNSLPQYY